MVTCHVHLQPPKPPPCRPSNHDHHILTAIASHCEHGGIDLLSGQRRPLGCSDLMDYCMRPRGAGTSVLTRLFNPRVGRDLAVSSFPHRFLLLHLHLHLHPHLPIFMLPSAPLWCQRRPLCSLTSPLRTLTQHG